MTTALEETPMTQFIQTLWKSRSHGMEDVSIGVRMPHTVVYEHNFPKGLFSTSSTGSLQRRSGKEIDSKLVVDVLSPRDQSGGGSGNNNNNDGSSSRKKKNYTGGHSKGNGAGAEPHHIVACYIERKTDTEQFSVQFLTDEGLRSFLLGAVRSDNRDGGTQGGGGGGGQSEPPVSNIHNAEVTLTGNKNGLLQQFTYPIGDHSEQIQVMWTPHLCLAEKVRNTSSTLWDVTKTPYQRGATFQGPPSFTTRAYVAPQVTDAIRKHCEGLAAQIYLVEHRPVEEMTMYFATDEQERLWFLWCPFIRLSSMPMDRRTIEDNGGMSRYAAKLYKQSAAGTSGYTAGGHHRSSNGNQSGSSLLPDFKVPNKYVRTIMSNKKGASSQIPVNQYGSGIGEISSGINESGGGEGASSQGGIGGWDDGSSNRMMRITMGASFVTISEEALLSADPAATQAAMDRRKREKEQQVEAQGGGKSNRSSLLASVTQTPQTTQRPTTAATTAAATMTATTSVPPADRPVRFKYPTMTTPGGDGGLSGGSVNGSGVTLHNSVLLGTKSRLCPKMRWLQGKPLTLDRPRSSFGTGGGGGRRSDSPSSASVYSGNGSKHNLTGLSPIPHANSTGGGGGGGDAKSGTGGVGENSSFTMRTLVDDSESLSNTHRSSHHGGLLVSPRPSSKGGAAVTGGVGTVPLIVYTMATPNPGLPANHSLMSLPPAAASTGSDLLLPGKKAGPVGEKSVAQPGREADVLREMCSLALDRRFFRTLNSGIAGGNTSTNPMEDNTTAELGCVAEDGLEIQPAATQADYPHAYRMNNTKLALKTAADFLEELRDTCLSHFLVNQGEPLAFSLPTFLFPCGETVNYLRDALGRHFATVTLEEALEMDLATDRVGTIDELSHHHTYPHTPSIQQYLQQQQQPPPPVVGGGFSGRKLAQPLPPPALPCFAVPSQASFRSFKAKLPMIMLVDFRNIHAETEYRLLRQVLAPTTSTAGGHKKVASFRGDSQARSIKAFSGKR